MPARLTLAFLALGAICAFASCATPVDLSAVSTYATTTAQSSAAFATISDDFHASCERYERIERGIIEPSEAQQALTILQHSPPLSAYLLGDNEAQPGYTPPAQLPLSKTAWNPPTIPTAVATITTNSPTSCADAAQVSKGWGDANTVLLNYVQALGNLAGVDSEPSVNPSPLAAGLTSAGVSSAATDAVTSLISSISAFYQQHSAQHDIAGFLNTTNDSMTGTIEALEVVDAAYTIRLHNEFQDMKAKYGAYVRGEVARRDLAVQRHDEHTADNISWELARAKAAVESALSATNDRLRASQDYGAAVEAILSTHQQLHDAAQRHAALHDYVQVFQTTGAPVLTNLQDLAKAVK